MLLESFDWGRPHIATSFRAGVMCNYRCRRANLGAMSAALLVRHHRQLFCRIVTAQCILEASTGIEPVYTDLQS
ncbi:hypothetical protein, partial [Yoonia sp.]|uniref:hypothetical protein n=1 Tax=Yoonia sp. TaxID=2212373 RepID=UPI0025E47F10